MCKQAFGTDCEVLVAYIGGELARLAQNKLFKQSLTKMQHDIESILAGSQIFVGFPRLQKAQKE